MPIDKTVRGCLRIAWIRLSDCKMRDMQLNIISKQIND